MKRFKLTRADGSEVSYPEVDVDTRIRGLFADGAKSIAMANGTWTEELPETVVVSVPVEMLVTIVDGEVKGVKLQPKESDAGYQGRGSHVVEGCDECGGTDAVIHQMWKTFSTHWGLEAERDRAIDGGSPIWEWEG